MTELEQQRRLSAAHRSADSDGKGAPGKVASERSLAVMKVSGVIERIVRMAVGAVMMGVHKRTSGLKQSGVQTVVRPLPEVEQRRGLREVVESERGAALGNRFGL